MMPAPAGVDRGRWAYYTSDQGYPIELAAAGRACRSLVAADGGADIEVGTLPHLVTGFEEPACIGCMYAELCQVLPNDAAPLAVGTNCPNTYPRTATILRPEPHVALVHLPPHTGPNTSAIAQDLVVLAEPGPKVLSATCALSMTQHRDCTLILNDFLRRYRPRG